MIKNFAEKLSRVLLFLIAIPLSLLYLISFNTALVVYILLAAFVIYKFAERTKYKKLIKVISIFIVIHIVIFPLLYMWNLKYDPNSLVFDSDILQNELVNAENEIIDKFKPEELKRKEELLSKLLKSKSDYMDSTMNIIEKDNILFIEDYCLHKSFEYKKTMNGFEAFEHIAVCDKKGKHLTNLNASDSKTKVSDYIIYSLKNIDLKNQKVISEREKIINKEIWEYSRILAYSINITFTSNIEPKTKLAQATFFLHKLIVSVFLFGLMASFVVDIIKKEKVNSI